MPSAGARPRDINNRRLSCELPQSPVGCSLPDATNASHSGACVGVQIVSHVVSNLSVATLTTTLCKPRFTTHSHKHFLCLVNVKTKRKGKIGRRESLYKVEWIGTVAEL